MKKTLVLATILSVGLQFSLPEPANARDSIRRSANPDVIVNLSALDALVPAPAPAPVKKGKKAKGKGGVAANAAGTLSYAPAQPENPQQDYYAARRVPRDSQVKSNQLTIARPASPMASGTPAELTPPQNGNSLAIPSYAQNGVNPHTAPMQAPVTPVMPPLPTPQPQQAAPLLNPMDYVAKTSTTVHSRHMPQAAATPQPEMPPLQMMAAPAPAPIPMPAPQPVMQAPLKLPEAPKPVAAPMQPIPGMEAIDPRLKPTSTTVTSKKAQKLAEVKAPPAPAAIPAPQPVIQAPAPMAIPTPPPAPVTHVAPPVIPAPPKAPENSPMIIKPALPPLPSTPNTAQKLGNLPPLPSSSAPAAPMNMGKLPPLPSAAPAKTQAALPPLPMPPAPPPAPGAIPMPPPPPAPAAMLEAPKPMMLPNSDPDAGTQKLAATKPPVSAVANSSPEIPSAVASTSPETSLIYSEAETDLPLAEQQKLQSVVDRMAADKTLVLNIVSFASGAADQAGQATRTSLARGLNVRRFFLDRNISRERINVRPLGNRSVSGVPDRVDIFLDKASKG